jgi:hypothetical protein
MGLEHRLIACYSSSTMHILEHLGLALGLATLAGVNLYLTVLITGLAIRFNLLNLAAQHEQLGVLAHPAVLIVAGVLFSLEFFADKVPWVDSLWDSVHTFIRPVGGVLLGLTALGEVPGYVQVVAALVAGGAALTTHGAKAGTRLLINHSPEPVTNITMSVTEDVAVAGGAALALLNPLVGLVVFATILIVLWLVFPRIWRGVRATSWLVWNKLKMPGRRLPISEPVQLKCVVSEELRNLLKSQAGIEADEVLATVRCLSGKARGVRGLIANLEGLLLLTSRNDQCYFAASKGLSDRIFRLPLSGSAVLVESKFLSENLILEGARYRAQFRFPRGQSEVIETLAMRLGELIQAAPVVNAATVEESVREPEVTSVLSKDELAVPVRSRNDESKQDSILPLPAIG